MSVAVESLDAILARPHVWRGEGNAPGTVPGIPTGHAELDVLLPGLGWPAGALTEIFVERPGIGELQLLMPAAARLTRDARWLAMIAPPYLPYAPAMAACGVHLKHMLLLNPQSKDEQAWAGEQMLVSGNCGAMLLWNDHLQDRTLRRLQHAAEHSGALAVIYRTRRAQPFASAALRLHVSRSNGRTVIQVLKRRGGGLPAPVQLDLHASLIRRGSAPRPEPAAVTDACLQHAQ
jgi:cell division inhibitor SulA